METTVNYCRWRTANYRCIFTILKNDLPFKERVVLRYKILNPLCPRMLCAKYDWNWSSGYGCSKDFEKVSDIANFSTWLVSTTERMAWRLLWTNAQLRLVCGNWKRYLKRRLHGCKIAQIIRQTDRRRITQSGNLSFQHKWG